MFAETEAFAGNTSYSTQTAVIGIMDQTYVSLHPVLHGDNPDNADTIAPYEKGFQMLQWVEYFAFDQNSTTGYYMMQDFITYYINRHSI